MNHHHEADVSGNEGRLVDRLMFFTDAVFAIVLTLLILELRPPEEAMATNYALKAALEHVVPYVFAFTASFALVGIFWFAHLQLTRSMRVFDWPVAVANMIFLFTIAFMPFTTALAATQGWLRISFQLYALNIIAASVAQLVLFTIMTRENGRLVGSINASERRYRLLRAATPGISFGLALGLTFTPLANLSFSSILSMPFLFLIAARIRPKALALAPTPTLTPTQSPKDGVA
jgi:uncharacterized membrane protein